MQVGVRLRWVFNSYVYQFGELLKYFKYDDDKILINILRMN